MTGPDARDGVDRAVADAAQRLRAAVHAAFDPDAGLAAVKAAAAHRGVDQAVTAADEQLLDVLRVAHDADSGLAAVKAAAHRGGPAQADPRRQAPVAPNATAAGARLGLVEFADLPQDTREQGLVLGMRSPRQPVVLDPYREPGLVIIGDAGCGKTTTLRVLGRQVLERHQPARAAVAVFDHRRTMLGEFDGPAVLGYAATAGQATELVTGLVELLTSRQPGPAVTIEQLRDRNRWTGPQAHVLVDDYELLAGESNPLLPLLPFLAQALDVGLHLYIAHRAGRASPTSSDPLLSAMRQLGFPALLMSSARDASPPVAVHPEPLPPGRGTLVHRRDGTVALQLPRLDAPTR